MHHCTYTPIAAGLRHNKAMELPGRSRWRAEGVAAGRRIWVVDTAASGGRDCGACGVRQLIAKPFGSRRTVLNGYRVSDSLGA
jgi:hypothetical protein